MDRLQSLTVALALALVAITVSCRDEATTAPASSRVNAVMAAPAHRGAVEAFCDVHATVERARPFALPPLAQGVATAARGWRWVNVWATWCHPCVEELPLLARWQRRLMAAGVALTIEFLSADATAEDVAAFRATHPGMPASLRIQDPALLPAWLGSLGLDAGATIPVQVLVDPAGRVRCVRSGAVTEADFATVQSIFSARAAE